MHQDWEHRQQANSRGSQCEQSRSRSSCQHPRAPLTNALCEPPPTYGLATLLYSMQRQLNSYVDKLYWDSDSGVEASTDQCCFLQLIFVLITVHTTIFCRMWDLFMSVSSVVVVAIQFSHFTFGQLLDIASIRNRQDVRTKTVVFCVQCVVLAMIAYPFVMVYAPVVQYEWYLFTSAVRIVGAFLINR